MYSTVRHFIRSNRVITGSWVCVCCLGDSGEYLLITFLLLRGKKASNRLQMVERRNGVVPCTYLGTCVWRNRRTATGVCPSLFAIGAYIKQAQWPNSFGQRSAFYCTELLHYIDVTGQLLRNSILFPFFCPYQFCPVVPFTSQCSFSRNRNLLLCPFRETEPVLTRVGRNCNFLFFVF